MSLWRQISRGLRVLTDRGTTDCQLDDEVRDYFERARADFVRAGLSPKEAVRAARLKLGDESRARETLREYGWENAVETTLRDLAQGWRRLRRSPGFTLIAVPTLAVGIGASTAIFSVVSPILLEPLPYPEAGRVVMLTDRNAEGAPLDVAYGNYLEIAARSRSFDRLAIADRWRPALIAANESEQLVGDLVSADYFRVLGVAPSLGRNFSDSDDLAGAPRVTIVSDGLAQRRFGAAATALNETVRLDNADYRVIGIMPPGFENALAPATQIWAPRRYRAQAPFQSGEWGHHLRLVGRLAGGVSVERAQDEIALIGTAPIAAFPRPPWASLENGLLIESLQAWVTAGSRPVLLALLSAVALLLIIACANVANLVLARSTGRRPELAMRTALGAGRGRLIRQLLTESLLLALVSGAVGLVVAVVGIESMIALAPADLPRVDAIRFDLAAFVFTLATTALVGLAVGLAPTLGGLRPDLNVDLHAGTRATSGSVPVLRRSLVVTEVALALVLLVGAGLLLRSVERLLDETPGFDSAGILTMQVVATGHRSESAEATLQYFGLVLDAVRAVPGVVEAALTSQLPLSGDLDGYGVQFESALQQFPGDSDGALRYVVTPDWFRTMGIPLVEGRLLDRRDRPGAPQAVLLSESLARGRFGDERPIGQRVRLGPNIGQPDDGPWGVVVGVVGDVKQASLALAPPSAFYVALGQWNWVDTTQWLAIRSRGHPNELVPAIRRAIWSVDSTSPIARVATMEDLLSASEAARRFALTVFAGFAAAALLLAALGLYGVIAGSVSERTREFGVRSALGASPGSILALVMRQSMRLAGLGVAIGLVGAATATRGLRTLLYGVTPLDPATYVSVVGLLLVVCTVAWRAPAARTARLNPTIALRRE